MEENNNVPSAVIKVSEIGDNVIKRIQELCEAGFTMPADYNYVNAIKMSYLKISEVKDKNGKRALEVCTPASIQTALFKMVTRGLNMALDQCYPIVRGDQLCIDPSYFGQVLLVKRIYPDWEPFPVVIHEGDKFVYRIDAESGRKILVEHEQDLGNIDKDFVGAYMYIPSKKGPNLYIMTKKQIMTAWSKSPSQQGVHKQFTEKMIMKGLALDTLIPTPTGYTTMGDIQVGDKLFNALGKETTVIAKSEVKHIPCYEITFSNGDSVIADEEHRWFARAGKGYSHKKEDWAVLTTQEMYVAKELGLSIVTPAHPTTEFKEKSLAVSPYILGYWLGNGSKIAPTVCCDEDDAEEIKAHYEKYYNVNARHDDRNRSVTLNISSKTGLRKDESSLIQQLRTIGVLDNKHIPMDYQRSSVQQRIELVRGLCDSDGHIDTVRGKCHYTTVKSELADGLYSILSSLGENVSRNTVVAKGFGTTTLAYELHWQPTFNPFTLKRKADRYRARLAKTECPIKSIRKIESVPTQCLAVESGDSIEENDLRKSFLFGCGFFVTHNTIVNSGCRMVINSTPELNSDDDDDETQNEVKDLRPSEFQEVTEEQPAIEDKSPKQVAGKKKVKEDKPADAAEQESHGSEASEQQNQPEDQAPGDEQPQSAQSQGSFGF